MRMKRLTSDRASLDFLEQLVAHGDSRVAEGVRDITNSQLERGRALLTQFQLQVNQLQQHFAQRRAQVAERRARLERLRYLVRDYWSNLQRRARREGSTDWGQAGYKLHASKPIGQMRNDADWLRAARELAEGEAKAVVRGESPLSNPSIDEITAQADLVQQAGQALAAIRTTLSKTREGTNPLREAIALLHNETAVQLRFTFRTLSWPARRDRMRDYGFTFQGKAGSPQGGSPGKESPTEEPPVDEPPVEEEPIEEPPPEEETQTTNP